MLRGTSMRRVTEAEPIALNEIRALATARFGDMIKGVVDLERGYLLGATFVGPGVAEMLHSATIAVAARVPIDRLWHAVPCFPTRSELWLKLLEAYGL